MANPELVNEDLWRAIVLWLPPERTDVRGGPRRVPNRAALAGVLFVLRQELRWRDLPQELGYGSGVTGDGCAGGRRRPSGPGCIGLC